MKNLMPFILIPFFSFGQLQIGQEINGEAIENSFGWCISLSSDGNVVAAGAPWNDDNGEDSGHVRVYRNESGVWTQIGNDINGDKAYSYSGSSVSLSSDGSVVAVGATQIYNDNDIKTGHVRVFKNESGVWTQIGNDIEGEGSPYSGSSDEFGYSISLSANGNIVAVGAPKYYNDNDIMTGHVRVFKNESGVWTQIGNNIDGEGYNDKSGHSVSLSSDGTIVAIGAPNNPGTGIPQCGHVRIYKYDLGVWTQIGNDIDGEGEKDHLGYSVSLSSNGDRVAIGAISYDITLYTQGIGYTRIYENELGTWTQVGNDINGEEIGGSSGFSVSLSSKGNVVAIGVPRNSGNIPYSSSGKVSVFKNESGTWSQIGSGIIGNYGGDNLGRSINLSSDGNMVAVGAPGNSDNGFQTGQISVYDLSGVLSAESFENNDFSLYPNPAKDIFIIELRDGIELEQVNIYNIQGQYLHSVKTKILDIGSLKSGLYFIEIETNKGKSTKKVMIK